MEEETKAQELSRVASEAADRFGLNAPLLKKEIESELMALVAAEVAVELYEKRAGKPPTKPAVTRLALGRRR